MYKQDNKLIYARNVVIFLVMILFLASSDDSGRNRVPPLHFSLPVLSRKREPGARAASQHHHVHVRVGHHSTMSTRSEVESSAHHKLILNQIMKFNIHFIYLLYFLKFSVHFIR